MPPPPNQTPAYLQSLHSDPSRPPPRHWVPPEFRFSIHRGKNSCFWVGPSADIKVQVLILRYDLKRFPYKSYITDYHLSRPKSMNSCPYVSISYGALHLKTWRFVMPPSYPSRLRDPLNLVKYTVGISQMEYTPV